jgi:hypothetical protein
MTMRDVVKSLILSPCYLKIKLKDRAKIVKKLTVSPGAPGSGVTEKGA